MKLYTAIRQSHFFSGSFVRGMIVRGIGRSLRNCIPLTIIPLTSPLLPEKKKAKKSTVLIFLPLSFCLRLLVCASSGKEEGKKMGAKKTPGFIFLPPSFCLPLLVCALG
jgi:hypothetical protein